MDGIQIFDVTLKDYRQYQGEQQIDLDVTGDEHINVLEGQNGSGKSNFLNAITLCLYGEEVHLDDDNENLESDPYINLSRLRELDDGDVAKGEIEVALGTDEPQYIFSRKIKTVKLGPENYHSDIDELQLKQKIGTDWAVVDNPTTRRKQILPTKIYQYFFFDGERLDEFFEGEYPSRVEDAIIDISQIDLLNRSIDHTSKVKKSLERDASKLNSETKQLQQEVEQEEEELERLQDRAEEIQTNIQEAEQRIEEIDEKLADSTDEEVRRLQEEREELDERVQNLKSELQERKQAAGETLADAGAIVYAEDALQYAKEQLDEMENEGQLPPKIQDWFIDELLERGTCICGEDLSDPDKQDHLESLRQEVATIADDNIEGKYEIPHVLSDGRDHVEQLIDSKADIESIATEIESLERRKQEISSQLGDKDLPEDVDVSELESRRSNISERIKDMNQELGRVESKIEQQQEVVDKISRKLNAEIRNREKQSKIMSRVDFLSDAENRLKDMKREILAEVRQDTQEALEAHFNDLIWKNEHYNIELTDGYKIKISTSSGRKKIGSLSAGEKQVLAISFLSGLAEISGFSAPFIIDTPLGRISSKPKRRIAQNLPDYLSDSQLTFLMTDEEYTEEVRARFKNSVSNEYHLNYESESTTVIPYE